MTDNLTQLHSSSLTLYYKVVAPLIGTCVVTAMLIIDFIDTSNLNLIDLIMVFVCAALWWWTIPIKRVWVNSDQFIIDNYWKRELVHTSRLRNYSVQRTNRTANALLYFDDTPFGRKVRVVVKWDSSGDNLKVLENILSSLKRKSVVNPTSQP